MVLFRDRLTEKQPAKFHAERARVCYNRLVLARVGAGEHSWKVYESFTGEER